MDNKKKYYLVAIVLFIISAIIAIGYTQIPDWDFWNYHYYSGWAFWNNRYDIDYMPASFRSYFNPLLDAADYFLIERFNAHPYIFLIIKHLRYFVFLFFSYLIFDFCISNKKINKNVVILMGVLFVVFSPMILLVANYTLNDLTIGTLILISIYITLINLYKVKNKINFLMLFLAGLIIGTAAGLKYTSGTFGIAVLLCTIFQYKKIDKPIKTLLILILGMLGGFVISNGWWMYFLYNKFGNPFFPYFSNIFRSEYSDSINLLSKDFAHLRPKGILEFIFWPLRNTAYSAVGLELPLYDIMIPISFISTVFYFGLIKFDNALIRLKGITKPTIFQFLILFSVFVYYINLFLFGQYRYIVAIYPILILITTIVYYLIFTSNKLKTPQFNIITLIFVFIFLIHGNHFESFMRLRPAVITMIAYMYAVLFYFNFTKSNSTLINKMNTAIGVTLMLFFATSVYPLNTIIMPYNVKNVISIKNADIEDSSNVLMGTVHTTAIIPFQNKNAVYNVFEIPAEVDSSSNESEINSNRHYYTPKIGKKIKEVFSSSKNLYFVYSANYINNKESLNMYKEAVKYYSGGKIKRFSNCKKINIYTLGQFVQWEDIYACKLR